MIRTYLFKNGALLLTFMVLLLLACSTSKRGLFAKKTAHEEYAGRIADAGLQETALGSLWFSAAEKALSRPLSITLPYSENGYFAAARPDAAGYLFPARRGEKVHIAVNIKPPGSLLLFADLWEPGRDNSSPSLLAAADTSTRVLEYEVERDGQLLLRLQPELLRSGQYTLTITTAPSLAFPVPGKTRHRIGSFWGDARDAGARQHEGIDIFGAFRTPVVAAADGYITNAGQNNLGGKVVFLRPSGKHYTLYYAHLDSQLVSTGQHVRTGDTLGLMGNTGNARTTPTHLHFGIYTGSGAVDPLPFVNTRRAAPDPVRASTDMLDSNVRNTTATTLRNTPAGNSEAVDRLPPNQLMQVLAATGNWYKVALPDKREGFVQSTAISGRPYASRKIANDLPLLDAPDSATAIKTTIPSGSSVRLLGKDGDYHFVSYGEQKGWLQW
ncbi:M23 family metallopeptidase [Chitinophaga japonensis]|uniref:Murein DD-endopeptidase MepM/ murein hydrolase activator NlpD n=1 Tax=Chitinophaga japonensis TaxID=104662 RepID=A0A562T743_CHIJA|nr:M23 family metallopeptidase [Chitinophaga japonensis]TWI88800.1 murein DD-endopeptidase MepM/ murein hydrolase activator NlpD [Chitinophaga japonensis]